VTVNPAKDKGDRAERALVDFLQHHGFTPRRMVAGQHDDIGDIDIDQDVVLEVKNRYRLELPAWCKTLSAQMGNKDAAFGFIAIKTRGKTDPLDWSFVVNGETFLNILRRIVIRKPNEATG
jgi:Holliday junction resolvase